MKVFYKGFDVEAKREMSPCEEKFLFYSVFRKSDGLEVTSGFSYGTDPIRTFIKYLKDIVDDFLEDPQAYYNRDRESIVGEWEEEDEPMTELTSDDAPETDEEEK
jgi:hypothetical protein